jgi:hypothetical protein
MAIDVDILIFLRYNPMKVIFLGEDEIIGRFVNNFICYQMNLG